MRLVVPGRLHVEDQSHFFVEAGGEVSHQDSTARHRRGDPLRQVTAPASFIGRRGGRQGLDSGAQRHELRDDVGKRHLPGPGFGTQRLGPEVQVGTRIEFLEQQSDADEVVRDGRHRVAPLGACGRSDAREQRQQRPGHGGRQVCAHRRHSGHLR
jgi:hypothetical protein